MRDPDFQIFVDKFGEACSSEHAPRATIEKYRQILPAALITIWENEGWCSYADGRFWTVDPDEYAHLAGMWLEGTPLPSIDRYHVIARSAFGSLYGWGERNNRRITIICAEGRIVALADRIGVPAEHADIALLSFFAMVGRDLFDFEDESGQFMFERALQTLGALDKTEMYGFESALSLGGRAKLENLKKVNLDVHLTLLREFSAPRVPLLRMGSAS
jgi:hypothetical protein